MNIGDKISFYRKTKGLTQEQLAEMLGVSRQSIYKWEANICRPSLEKIKLLTEILSIDFNSLLG